uniref:Uncharacterized protein n=1 Tax=Romanomermis culicivorax TaxID=13658 RepID=A0A915JAP7_ROMCU
MKGQQLAISEEFSIEEAEVYEYEMIEKRTNLEGDHVGLEMELTNNYVVEKEEMPTNVEALDRVTAREEDSNLAVGASSTEHLSLNTDNVNAICSANLRRKRNVIPYCRLYSEEGEEVKKVNYEEIEESVKQRYPSLHEHISILNEVSGKLQLAFIGRDMIGQLYQKDWQGLARSALFFGAVC